MNSGVSGASSGEFVIPKASSGAWFHGFSRTPHSFARPQRFWSTEYGLSRLAGTGTPFALAYPISSSRDHFHSRTGAITFNSGSSAAIATSKRTWSFPLPVQP